MKGSSQSFTTDYVPVSDRQEAWLLNARQFCGESKFQFPKRYPFHGSIVRRKIANLELTLFSSSSISFSKFPSDSLNSDNRACIVISQLAGVRSYRQDGKVAVLTKGDATLIDSGRPWTSDCPGDCARLYLRVPWQFMQSRVRLKELPIAKRISGDSSLGSLLFHLSEYLYTESARLTDRESVAATEAYLRILAECVRPTGSSVGQHGGDQLPRILDYIEANLADGSLSPPQIARAVDLSVRHVHRLFADKGSSVSDWIKAKRLEHCKDDLANPVFDSKSITEIAFFWGFNDSAHFSRAFRQEFGASPSSFRALVQARSLKMPDVPKASGPLNPASVKHLRRSEHIAHQCRPRASTIFASNGLGRPDSSASSMR
jgi:AraC family transcriptional regulator, positive regulator of tynA and feaB